MNKKKIGLLGGTFDPIHFGHLALAIELLEKKKLDEIWFVPAFISPLRKAEPPIQGHYRKQMLELAIENAPLFKCYDGELEMKTSSHTLVTVCDLKKKFPRHHFFLILGEDIIFTFHLWKDVETLVKEIPLLIGCRRGVDLLNRLDLLPLSSGVKKSVLQGMVETKVMEISSTEIRQRIKKRLYCSHLIPAKVVDYIYENQLYF